MVPIRILVQPEVREPSAESERRKAAQWAAKSKFLVEPNGIEPSTS